MRCLKHPLFLCSVLAAICRSIAYGPFAALSAISRAIVGDRET